MTNKREAPSISMVCEECDGEGRHEVEVYAGGWVVRTVVVDPCEVCNGCGTVAYCDNCGWVPWEEDTWTIEKHEGDTQEYCLICTEEYEKGRLRKYCRVCGGNGWTDSSAELRRDGLRGDTTCIGCNGTGKEK